MRHILYKFVFLIISFLTALTFGSSGRKEDPSLTAGPVQLINKNYDRLNSKVLIRKIMVPTRANLDFAAYAENVVRADTARFITKPPEKTMALTELDFSGALVKSRRLYSSSCQPSSDIRCRK